MSNSISRLTRPGSGDPRRLHQLRTNDHSTSTRSAGPILAVESKRSGFAPRRLDHYEACETDFYYEFDEQLTEHLLDREREAIDHTEIARRVIFEGYFQFFEFLRLEVRPADADFCKYPYGGFPPKAFHHGVTQEVLKLRHDRVLAAMVQLGLSTLKEADRRRTGALDEEISLAFGIVLRTWNRAFAEQKPLPTDTLDYYRRAQFWLPPRVYAKPTRAIEAKPALKLLTGPAHKSLPADFWS